MDYQLLHGDALKVLQTLPSASVHMVCTSPPYWNLRDYGTATWEGGAADCDHVGVEARTVRGGAGKQYTNAGSNRVYSGDCACGARRVDQQIGLEPTVEAYVAQLVDVFREVRRVLHKTGVVFLNLGDSYAGGGGFSPSAPSNQHSRAGQRGVDTYGVGMGIKPQNGLKPKDLCMIPARVAIALQADGWWLRSAITWCKTNPMPESVLDRPTSATEMVFMLAKSERYFYDAEAIKEPNSPTSQMGGRFVGDKKSEHTGNGHSGLKVDDNTWNGRNRRNWWVINSAPYPGAHFATMPTKLVEPCILAGSSSYGACAKCLAPYERVTERTREHGLSDTSFPKTDGLDKQNGHKRLHQRVKAARAAGEPHDNPLGGTVTTGWAATCTCAADVIACTVLDCFSGAGTTGVVATRHHRRYIGIDLNESYNELARRRIEQTQPMLMDVT